MKKSLWSVFAVASMFFTSCGDELHLPENKKLPTQFEVDNSIIRFTYNSNSQLTKLTEVQSNVISKDCYISYSENGKPSKLTLIYSENNNTNTELITVQYNSDTQITLTNDVGDVVFITTDEAGRIVSNSSLQGTISYSYDSNGNNVQVNKDGYTMSVVYGANYGIFKSVNTPQWMFSLLEEDYQLFKYTNPTSKTIVESVNGLSTTTHTTYQYPTDFINEGYPSRVISTKTQNGVTNQSLLKITY